MSSRITGAFAGPLYLGLTACLLGCEGVVHLRTCNAGFVEERVDHQQYYCKVADGVRIAIAASAVSSPNPSRCVPFSFTISVRNVGRDSFLYSCKAIRLWDSESEIPVKNFWVPTNNTGEGLRLQPDTMIKVDIGEEAMVRFTAGSGECEKSWDGIWLSPGSIRAESNGAEMPLDSVCLRLKIKGVDF